MNNASIDNPLVSIIMNCRNGEAYLRESLDSVYAQSYTNWEIIFWDNASTDGSAAIAKSYNAKLRYFKNDLALTLGEVRNLAMTQAKGKYLVFLDCDDKLLTQKLQKQVAILECRNDIDFVYSNYFRLIMPETSKLPLALRGRQPEGYVFGSFLRNYPAGLLTVMLRFDAIKRAGTEFDGKLELAEEFDFFMRILLKSKALYIDEPLAIYRVHQNMSSAKSLHKHIIEATYILDKLKSMDTSVKKKYAANFRYFEAKLGYWNAKMEIDRHNQRLARKKLSQYKFMDMKFFILYILTYFPPIVWNWLHRYKLEGKFQ